MFHIMPMSTAMSKASQRRRMDDPEPGAMKAQADFLLARIREAVKMLPAYATPPAVIWTTEPWTVESTLVTQTHVREGFARVRISGRIRNQ